MLFFEVRDKGQLAPIYDARAPAAQPAGCPVRSSTVHVAQRNVDCDRDSVRMGGEEEGEEVRGERRGCRWASSRDDQSDLETWWASSSRAGGLGGSRAACRIHGPTSIHSGGLAQFETWAAWIEPFLSPPSMLVLSARTAASDMRQNRSTDSSISTPDAGVEFRDHNMQTLACPHPTSTTIHTHYRVISSTSACRNTHRTSNSSPSTVTSRTPFPHLFV